MTNVLGCRLFTRHVVWWESGRGGIRRRWGNFINVYNNVPSITCMQQQHQRLIDFFLRPPVTTLHGIDPMGHAAVVVVATYRILSTARVM